MINVAQLPVTYSRSKSTGSTVNSLESAVSLARDPEHLAEINVYRMTLNDDLKHRILACIFQGGYPSRAAGTTGELTGIVSYDIDESGFKSLPKSEKNAIRDEISQLPGFVLWSNSVGGKGAWALFLTQAPPDPTHYRHHWEYVRSNIIPEAYRKYIANQCDAKKLRYLCIEDEVIRWEAEPVQVPVMDPHEYMEQIHGRADLVDQIKEKFPNLNLKPTGPGDWKGCCPVPESHDCTTSNGTCFGETCRGDHDRFQVWVKDGNIGLKCNAASSHGARDLARFYQALRAEGINLESDEEIANRKDLWNRYFEVIYPDGSSASYLYDRRSDQYLNWTTFAGMMFSSGQGQDFYDYRDGLSAYAGRTIEESEVRLIARSQPQRTYAEIIKDPGRPSGLSTETNEDNQCYNTFKMPDIVAEETAEGQYWLDHLKHLVPDEREQEIVLSWFAHVVLRPGIRTRWVLGLFSHQEQVGKNLLLKPITQIIGENNCSKIDDAMIDSQFNSYADQVLIELSEVSKLPDKSEVTDDWIYMRDLYRSRVRVRNCMNFVMTTNRAMELPLLTSDARTCIIQCSEDMLTQTDHGMRIINFLNTKANVNPEVNLKYLNGIKHILCQIDLSEFEITAPLTSTKLKIIERNKEDLEPQLLLAKFKPDPEGHMHSDQIAELLEIPIHKLPSPLKLARKFEQTFTGATIVKSKCKKRGCDRNYEKIYFGLSELRA